MLSSVASSDETELVVVELVELELARLVLAALCSTSMTGSSMFGSGSNMILSRDEFKTEVSTSPLF